MTTNEENPKVYITALGKFFPGHPVTNDEMEDYLGRIHGKDSRVRQRILRQNGILTRHYAIDKTQKTLHSNASMAAHAVRDALARAGLAEDGYDLLAAATSQGDLPLPGFASMVLAELAGPPIEIATLHGVCASGVMALQSAALQIACGRKQTAIACASEFPSRLLKASRFEAQDACAPSFDTEFLRWMLSDGAGAAVLEPRPRGLSLAIEWIELRSFAGQHPACMYVGPERTNGHITSWLDYPDYRSAAEAGAINLRQDVRMLDQVVQCAVQGALQLVEQGRLNPNGIDWLVAHYSSHIFRQQAYELACQGGLSIPLERWFTNLYSKGNVGAASIFVLLEELMNEGKLDPGQTIFCMVPESGGFVFGYILLRVVEGKPSPARTVMPTSEAPHLAVTADPLQQKLVRQLGLVWIDFENRLRNTPIVKRLCEGRFTTEDYRRLLFNLRQQVIDGSRWIARAASNVTSEYFPIRSAFIRHTSDEHRDFEMLERNYISVGGSAEELRAGSKNIGSEALSSYILHRASRENPFDLIGAMFIIEGLGQRIARGWGERIKEQLGLENQQVSFFLYHSESDVEHFRRLDLSLAQGILTEALVEAIVKCAKVTARLYVLQLEELDKF